MKRATQSTSLAPATLDGLLAVRGVIDVSEASDDDEAITAAGTQMLATLDQANALADGRASSGQCFCKKLT